MSDPYILVHPIEARGTKYQVHVTEGGEWVTTVGSERITGVTRAELKSKLLELSAKAAVKVAIPFTLMTAGRGIRKDGTNHAKGIVTGIHAGNGNLLVKWLTGWQAGESTQWTPSYNDVIFEGDVSDEDIRTWTEMNAHKQLATRVLFEFEQAHKIELRDRVVVAIKEAVEHG